MKLSAANRALAGKQRPQSIQDIRVEIQAILYDGACVACLALKTQLREIVDVIAYDCEQQKRSQYACCQHDPGSRLGARQRMIQVKLEAVVDVPAHVRMNGELRRMDAAHRDFTGQWTRRCQPVGSGSRDRQDASQGGVDSVLGRPLSVTFALIAKVRRLLMFHHDPLHSDAQLEAMLV